MAVVTLFEFAPELHDHDFQTGHHVVRQVAPSFRSARHGDVRKWEPLRWTIGALTSSPRRASIDPLFNSKNLVPSGFSSLK
jgi:hypothetical protein